MRGKDLLSRRAASNLAAAKMDLARATEDDDEDRITLLETILSSGADILLYRPQLQHYALLFGDLETAEHVAVFVPGVGDGSNLCEEWIPDAFNLYEASTSTAVVLWKGYDNPPDVLAAAAGSIECNEDLATAAHDLTEFIASLSLEPAQSLTVIAHSFGSIVTGAALADAGLVVTDVVVAGSPGMTVDGLRDLHLEQSHFFSEQAPGDAIAELGVFGAQPASPKFGGTRMSTNAPDHPPVAAHSRYFEPGSDCAGEHGRCRHGPVLGHPAAPGRLPRDRRRPRCLGPAHAHRPAPGGRPPLPGPRVPACWPTGAAWSTSGRARRATWSARCSTRASAPCCGSPTGWVRCRTTRRGPGPRPTRTSDPIAPDPEAI